jgi:PKD repeat protein
MKRQLLITFALFLFSFNPLIAQQVQFQKSFQVPGSYDAFCMQEVTTECCNEGATLGYIIITDSYALIKTDLAGNILWSKQFTYPYNYADNSQSLETVFYGGFSDYVQVTSDCGFLIAGSVVDSNGRLNYNLIKTDMSGNLEWNKQYIPPVSDSLFNCIYDVFDFGDYWGKVGVKARQTDDNGYIILGQVNSKTSNLTHFQMIKTNSTGDVEWTKYYDGNIFKNSFYFYNDAYSNIYDIELAGSGPSKGFILLGQVIDSTEWNDYYVLIRTDSMGNVMWSKKYLTEKEYEPEAGVAIKQTKDNGFVITGLGKNDVETIVFKTDSVGTVKWFNRYYICSGTTELIEGNSIKQTYDGGYIIGCSHTSSGPYYEALLLKIDSIGTIQWLMSYQRLPHDTLRNNVGEACSAIQTLDSGYAFCGSIGFESYTNILFVKTDKNGYSGCFDTLVPLCIYKDSLIESSFGDTMSVSVTNSLINQTITVPTITVTNYCVSADTTDTSGITICPTAVPVANFQSGQTILCANGCINFTDLSTNATSWQWSFAGALDSTSTAQNPQNVCYQKAGVYNVTLIASNALGSDTVTFVNYITVNPAPPPPLINQQQNHDTIYCSTDTSYISYQWSLDSMLIAGATDTFLVVSKNGNYNVAVTNRYGCQISVGINIVLGIQNYAVDNIISLFPNPATNQLNIHSSAFRNEGVVVEVVNLLGQNASPPTPLQGERGDVVIDVSKLSAGMYFVEMKTESGIFVKKFVKE